ncbi:peroxiredoxin [Arthrobacter sp. MYb224]|uniref:redoxin domain-containing protein n=1 Tax=Arthrobacter sp. MYb224 TaxID=1848600 RepID=UPI000CFC65A4|nr:redoxin domain-containing protein [Arthrobacter sp. MYb224]PRA00972.1 peroxiredoxin [Arthrobacter sp. MYb224]
MIETGSRLFDFSLENQYGETITSTQLASGRVLVVFYPWAFSRVCGSELAEIQEHHQAFLDRQVRVVAISVDHKFALRTYAEQLGVEFDLLADFWPHGEVAQGVGAFDEEKGVATRLSLYLVDGVVQRAFTSAMAQPRPLGDYLEAIDSSQ